MLSNQMIKRRIISKEDKYSLGNKMLYKMVHSVQNQEYNDFYYL